MSRSTAVAGLVTSLWLVVYAVAGRLSDDGLHAYAARELLRGRTLYVDFEYHQAPLLPELLALWFRLTGVGLLQARLFAVLVGFGCLGLAWRLARRLGAGPAGVAVATWAVALSPSLPLHLSYVQSQGLATLLALAAVAAVLRGGAATPLGWALAAGAAGARVSFVVLPLALGWYSWRRDRREALVGLLVWLATLIALFAPHWRAGGLQQMLYLPVGPTVNDVTRYYGQLYFPVETPLAALGRRLGSWPNQIIYYAPLWLATLSVWRGRRTPEVSLVLQVALLLTLVHGVLPQRVNHSYLVVAMPFWAVLAAAWRDRPPRLAGWGRLLLLVAAGAAINRGLGRLDVVAGRPMLSRVADAARLIREVVPVDGELFTFAVELAVAADRSVSPGLECGYFAYYPNMPDEVAARCRVVNHRGLLEPLAAARPTALLLSDRAFEPVEKTAWPWPDNADLWAAIAAAYRPAASLLAGERRQPLTLLLRQEPPPERR